MDKDLLERKDLQDLSFDYDNRGFYGRYRVLYEDSKSAPYTVFLWNGELESLKNAIEAWIDSMIREEWVKKNEKEQC